MYADESAISDWAKSSVAAMKAMGIMQGVSPTEFEPQGEYTVEQAIATMVRLYECYQERGYETYLSSQRNKRQGLCVDWRCGCRDLNSGAGVVGLPHFELLDTLFRQSKLVEVKGN